MSVRPSSLLLSTVLFIACGNPGGAITGRVTVEGGSAANVPVLVYGPQSMAALTGEDGAFTASGLPDGRYLVRAVVRGADVEELSAPVTLAAGKADTEPTLAFKAKAAPGRIVGRVTVEGGSAAGVTVFVHGPQSSVAVTMADGSFESAELPDGRYVVRAVVRGAEVEEQTASTRLTAGRLESEPVLAFRFPATSTVTGRVTFADGSDASNLAVTLVGREVRAARTGAMGAFSFAGVPAGAAVVSVEAQDTREGRVSLGVAVSGAMVDVGELALTPVARVGGTVTFNSAPVSGAEVFVAGTGLAALTNAMGRFELGQVPVGDVTLVARATGPSRSGSATQRLLRGGNMDVALTLTEERRVGTVAGVVGFSGPQSPTLISISAPGTTATSAVAANGAWSLTLPVGEWEVVATAPFHPRQVLGRVAVLESQTTRLPAAVLSFFEPLWDSGATLSALSSVTSAPQAPWFVLSAQDALQSRAVLFNPRTRDVRVLAVGTPALTRVSTTGRYVAFVLSSQVMTYEVATGQLRAWANSTNLTNLTFSSDESVLFLGRTNALERLTLATGVLARFPQTGDAVEVRTHTPDRWLVREPSGDVQLVEPTTVTPQLFTNVSAMFATPTPLALVNCAISCALQVVAPTARVANPVAGSWPTNSTVFASPGDFPLVLNQSTGQYFIVRAADGTGYPLAPNTTGYTFNSTGTRLAYTSNILGVISLREESLPPTPTTTPVAQSSAGFTFSYATPTRLLAWDPARRVVDVRSGVATIDASVAAVPATARLSGASIAWPSSLTMKWKAIVGDRAAVDLDVPATVSALSGGARALGPVTDFAAFSFDTATSWVVDGRQGTARRNSLGRVASFGREGMTEMGFLIRSGSVALLVFDTDQVLEHQDPRFAGLGFQTFATADMTLWLATDDDRRVVSAAWLR